MFKKVLAWIALLAVPTLMAGCLATVQHNAANPATVDKLTTAEITWYQPSHLPFQMIYPTEFSQQQRESLGNVYRRDMGTFQTHLQKTTPAGLSDELKSRGVPGGKGATLTLRPVRLTASAGGSSVVLDVNVRTNKADALPWSFEIVAGAGMGVTPEQASQRLIREIAAVLEKAGFVGSAN